MGGKPTGGKLLTSCRLGRRGPGEDERTGGQRARVRAVSTRDQRSEGARSGGDAEIEALYAVRPDRFVAARNELAKALKAAGRRDDAATVTALRRPTPAAWALNQVARERAEELEALLDAGAALRAATERALAGRRADLRVAQDEQRRALDTVLDAAVGFARGLGSGNLDQLRRRAAGTLHAAIADDELRARLREGRLDSDVDAPGFGLGFDAFAESVGADEVSAEEDSAEDRGDTAARARQEAERTAARKAAEREVERREREADRLERAADKAEHAAREARRKADDAAAELARARDGLDELDRHR